MKPKQIMLIAGEPSGDLLAAELVAALRRELTAADTVYSLDQQPLRTGLEPRFFGAGGPRMKAAGVELAFDLTQHSVIGFIDGLRFYFKIRRRFRELLALAIARQPDVIIGVDYNYFNLRFAHAIRKYVNARSGWFHDWRPKIVKYVSPQVWASRPGRVYTIARDHDLLLSIFPFEKEWYAKRVRELRVEFVGHPLVERLRKSPVAVRTSGSAATTPVILLLPGSRKGALYRHLPAMLGAARLISSRQPARWLMVLPSEKLAYILAKCLLQQMPECQGSVPASALQPSGPGLEAARQLARKFSPELEIQIGNLPDALAQADLAITSTGTVTMECASLGLPSVTLYKAAWLDYQIARRLVKVKSLTMPNLIADDAILPEFIQDAATPENISRAALDLLQNPSRREQIKERLAEVVASLGGPGANRRAARAIADVLGTR